MYKPYPKHCDFAPDAVGLKLVLLFFKRLNACHMEYELSSLSEGELVKLYYQINKQLKEQFLNKVPWEEEQKTINNLTRISEELIKRKTKLSDGLKEERLSA